MVRFFTTTTTVRQKNTFISGYHSGKLFLAGSLLLVLASVYLTHYQTRGVFAQTTSNSNPTSVSDDILSLQKKIEERNKNIETLTKEIEHFKNLKDKTSGEALTLQRTLRELEQNGKMLELDIKRLSSKIDKANFEIKKTGLNISSTESDIHELEQAIASSIRLIQRNEDTGPVITLLSKNNLSAALVEAEQHVSFARTLDQKVKELETLKQKLQFQKKEKETIKQELADLQNELKDKKKVVEYNKLEKSKTLVATKNLEKNYQQIIKDRQQKKADFEKELFSYESELKFKLDPASIPRPGTAVFVWPLDNVRITQRFGRTQAAKRLYVSGSHNGMDFGATVGTPIKAMADGVVGGTGDTDLTCAGASFGRWVFLRFSNGLAATYGHLSVISVQEGQVVKAGQIIGYSGNTGYSTGPHLHISVYASAAVKVENRPSKSCGGRIYRMPISPVDAYLDPAVYLPAN